MTSPLPTEDDSRTAPANRVARVVIDLSLDREFDYAVPPELRPRVRVGSRVRVPFGQRDRPRTGFVVGLQRSSRHGPLKPLLGIEGDRAQIPDALIELARWIADYYCCPRDQAVRAMLPAVVRGGRVKRKLRNFAVLAADVDWAGEMPALEARAPKQARVMHALVRLGPCSVVRLAREADAGPEAVRRLRERGLITVEKRVVARDPFADDIVLPTVPLVLTPDQRRALEVIRDSLEQRDRRVILLHGVTGSGKTEVYLQVIERCLQLGLEAIVLVPEISLTPQTTERFRGRFGEHVSVLHSGLSDGERFDEWTRINEGRSRIVVGARSALFAPFRKLGLIVVDEEHETTYKQDEAPRYNARDVAVVRGRIERATVVLGSATPALETYYNARRNRYVMTQLPCRVDHRQMPAMELVDMRAEAALRGGAKIFSRRLEDLIRQRLEDGEQTILFLNRRGYATQMLCTQCGFVATCDDCSVAYTYHRRDQLLCCHLCGRVLAAPKACPQCGDAGIRYTGLGTEKVEAVARKLFPQATVERMDSDSMTGKNAHKRVLNAFRAGRIHILIGTQMIAKGLDFPNVTLVGVIFADLSLYLPDFRASERTFQLLTQVSGRAGRGDTAGRVVVQSYTPFHPAMKFALEHDYRGFAEQELDDRLALGFPPATHMAIVHFRGPVQEEVAAVADTLTALLRPQLDPGVVISGPAPAPTAKVRGLYRYQLVLRGGHTRRLVRLLRQTVLVQQRNREVEIHVDVDPVSVL